jgi:hypothetical protein
VCLCLVALVEGMWDGEFSGGWWRQICFAVFDPRGDGNFEVFRRVLQDQKV